MSEPMTLEQLIDRLENFYSFDCEAGPLKHCVDWQALTAALRAPVPEARAPLAERAHELCVELAHGTNGNVPIQSVYKAMMKLIALPSAASSPDKEPR